MIVTVEVAVAVAVELVVMSAVAVIYIYIVVLKMVDKGIMVNEGQEIGGRHCNGNLYLT